MPQGRRATSPSHGAGRRRPLRRAGALLAALLAAAAGTAGCMAARAHMVADAGPSAPRTHPPAMATTVLADAAPDLLSAEMAQQLFAAAPVVVVADPDHLAAIATAVSRARRANAPLLLTAAQGDGARLISAALRAEIKDLHPRAVLAIGMPAEAVAALSGSQVVTSPAGLPATSAPAPLTHVAVLVPQRPVTAADAAAAATAEVAGATVVPVRGGDPRADPSAVTALAATRPRHVLAVGAGFRSAGRLAGRVAIAATGVQLPGGGQVVFPGRRLVALYGHPGLPALGVLGRQDLPASVERAKRLAARYRPLSNVPVVPAFEIIATVALAGPGKHGDYSAESSVASLRPWVKRAIAAGMYVVLDLQPGRASLLTQAKRYEPLLRMPDVGLALDAEWKLQPGQLPLRQIGSVRIGEINSVISWLAALTAAHHLPQKVLVLHQFRLSMIEDEQALDTRHDDLAVVIHMDGQGTPSMKQTTWHAVTRAAPRRVFFGWKNFYVMDHPMLSPDETMTKTPRPVMISYQ